MQLYSQIKDTLECKYYITKSDFIANVNGKKEIFKLNERSDIEDKTGAQVEFKIRALKKVLKPKFIDRDIFAIVTPHDTLINTYTFDKRYGYSKLYTVDSFLVIYSYKKAKALKRAGYWTGGLLGGIITSAIALDKSAEAYIFSPNTDKKIPLTKSTVLYHLKSLNNKEVVKNFKDEESYDLNILMTYFKYYVLVKYGKK
jgi:hypothetical protein